MLLPEKTPSVLLLFWCCCCCRGSCRHGLRLGQDRSTVVLGSFADLARLAGVQSVEDVFLFVHHWLRAEGHVTRVWWHLEVVG